MVKDICWKNVRPEHDLGESRDYLKVMKSRWSDEAGDGRKVTFGRFL